MNVIINKRFPLERALYAVHDTELQNCTFDGIEDGESALKETKNIRVYNCSFNLRYPLWHANGVYVENSVFTDKCRAPIWYSQSIESLLPTN